MLHGCHQSLILSNFNVNVKTGRLALIICKIYHNELYLAFSSTASLFLQAVSSSSHLPLKSYDFTCLSGLNLERGGPNDLRNNMINLK
jgi:hypothetical protein